MIIKRKWDVNSSLFIAWSISRNYCFKKFLQMLIGLGIATKRNQYKSEKLDRKSNSFLPANTLCQKDCNYRGCSFKSHTSMYLTTRPRFPPET